MGERIFVGYMVSQNLQDTIARWREKYSDLPIQWNEDKDLHVTFTPPWDEEDIPGVIKTLQASRFSMQPFTFTLEQITFGQPAKRRQIRAIGPTTDELIALRTHIETTLQRNPIGWSFALHVTVGRFEARQFINLQKTIPQSILWKETVSAFHLLQSDPQVGRSASYKILAEISF